MYFLFELHIEIDGLDGVNSRQRPLDRTSEHGIQSSGSIKP
jgi:hypothetical protein